MKRIFSLVLALLLLLCCSCSKKDSGKKGNTQQTEAPSEAVTVMPGKESIFTTLIMADLDLANNTFVFNHLPVDKAAKKAEGKTTWYKVSEKSPYKTYAELEAVVNATFTADTAAKLLDGSLYKEIDGALYCAADSFNAQSGKYELDNVKLDTQNAVLNGSVYTVTATVIFNGSEVSKTFKFNTSSASLLTEFVK